MIAGAVTTDREAVIRMVVRGPAGQEQGVEAVVDSGFDGWFSLPPALIALLELPWWRRGRALLADGNETESVVSCRPGRPFPTTSTQRAK